MIAKYSQLMKLAILLAAAVASAAPPTAIVCEYHTRVLRVGTISPEAWDRAPAHSAGYSMDWSVYRFSVIDVLFDQPLYMIEGRSSGRSFNQSHAQASLDGSFTLQCPGRPLLSLSTTWDPLYWRKPSAALLATHSPHNSMRGLMDAFHEWRDDDAIDSSSTDPNAFSLMIMLQYQLNEQQPVDVLPLDVSTCVVAYVSAKRRAALSQPSQAAVPGALANFAREEIQLSTRPQPPPDGPVTVERTAVHLQRERDDKGNVETKSAQHWEAAHKQARNRTLEAERAKRDALHADPVHGATAKQREEAAETVLLQERVRVLTEQAQFLPLEIPFIMAGSVRPTIINTGNLMNSAIMGVAGNKLFGDLNAQVTPDLVNMLGVTLRANLSNVLVDSLSYSLSKALAMALTRSIGPFLVNKLGDSLTPALHTVIDAVLQRKLPRAISGSVSLDAVRMLPLTLVPALTRSVTLALTPALVDSLSQPPDDHNRFCALCVYYQAACHLCRGSPQGLYYDIYHSHYFAEYYSNYYADYYTQAWQNMDAFNAVDFNGMEPIPTQPQGP